MKSGRGDDKSACFLIFFMKLSQHVNCMGLIVFEYEKNYMYRTLFLVSDDFDRTQEKKQIECEATEVIQRFAQGKVPSRMQKNR